MLDFNQQFNLIKNELASFRNLAIDADYSFFDISETLELIMKETEFNLDRFLSVEEKIKIFTQIGFLTIYPRIGLYANYSNKAFLYELSPRYFDRVKKLLPELANKELGTFYKNLINVSKFFSKIITAIAAPLQRYQNTLKLKNKRALFKFSEEEIHKKVNDYYCSNENKFEEELIVTLGKEWEINRPMHKKDIFNHSYFKENFNEIVGYLYHHYLYKVLRLDKRYICNVPHDSKVLKLYFEFGRDLVEIGSILYGDFNLYSNKAFIMERCQSWERELRGTIDPFREKEESAAEKIRNEILNSTVVKIKYFKRRANVLPVKPVVKNKTSINVKVKPKNKPPSYQSDADSAYMFYQNGQFKEAIKSFEKLIFSKETLNRHTRIKQVKILSSIGDCYSYWYKSERQNPADVFGLKLEEKALEYYGLAQEQIAIGLQEFQDQPQIHEWRTWSDFNNMSISSLKPKQYLSDLREEVEKNSVKALELLPSSDIPIYLEVENQSTNDADSRLLELYLEEKVEVLDIARQHYHQGFLCYMTGGAVRDIILGLPPSDFDLATTAHPHLSKKMAGERGIIVGRYYPVVRVNLSKGQSMDIKILQGALGSSKAIEVNLDDGKGLVTVVPTNSVREDSVHRDFKINSLFYNFSTKKILDPTGGLKDLRNKILSTTIDPVDSFKIDPLRMIRLIRYKAKLDFSIEPHTEQALIQCHEWVKFINPSRLMIELHKLLFNNTGLAGLSLLNHYKLLTLFNYKDKNEVLTSVIALIVKKMSFQDKHWVIFLAAFFWLPIQQVYECKNNSLEEMRKIIEEVIECYRPYLFKVDMKVQQFWLLAIGDEVLSMHINIEEYGMVDDFKKIIRECVKGKNNIQEHVVVSQNKHNLFSPTILPALTDNPSKVKSVQSYKNKFNQ